MAVKWTTKALNDAERLCLFLAQHDRDVASSLAQKLRETPVRVVSHPRLGERVDSYILREVRKLSIGRYVMHYELRDNDILTLRIWHGREERR